MAAAAFRAAGFAATLGLAGCTSLSLAPTSLDNSDWTVVSVNGQATPASAGYHMQFGQPEWHGGFGCNGMTAEYRLATDELLIGRMDGPRFVPGSIMATERDCSGAPTGHFEGEAVAILMKPMKVRFASARRMILANAGGRIELVRRL